MESSITGSGKTVRGMGEENRFGKMEPFTKAIGKMIWQTGKADSFRLEETFTKVNG
jgi:hypothetical protein